MDANTIMAVFNTVLQALSTPIAVIIGVLIAGAVLMWVISRFTG